MTIQIDPRPGPRAILIDITRCIGCNACVEGCMAAHGQTGDAAAVTDLSAENFTAVLSRGDVYVRRLCMHCETPSCASVCPVGAFEKTAAGPVLYDASKCLGCRYCMQACPFQVPRYEWTKRAPAVTKCDMCAERQAAGRVPACVESCPMEATVFGTRDELLAEAHRRIAESPDAYHPHVYGETEVGGTSVLFLSPVPFEELGFAVDLGDQPLPDLTGRALARVPDIVTVGGALLLGIWWITKRRDEVARVEGCCAPAAAAAPAPSATVIEEVRHDG